MTDVEPTPPPQTRVAAGAAWVVGWRFSTRLLGFLSTFILVRLLAPADFGLIMLATTFTDGVDALSALGIQDAIVREKAPSRSLYDTAFTMNAIRSLTTASLIAAGAWPAAAFFAEPRVADVLLALALLTAAGAAENIRVVDFRRNLVFHQEFKLFLLPRVISIIACIAVAAVSHSYWALIVGLTTSRLLQLVLGYVMRPYKPSLCLREWRQIIGFSTWTWLSSLVVLVRDRSDNIVIGRVLGTAQVGIYSIASELAALPTTELIAPICRVLFPSFTVARHANGDMAAIYLRTIAVTLLITMPAGVGISMVAGPLIALIFGPNWTPAVPVLSLLAIAGTLKVISLISGTLFAALGLLSANFRIILVTAVVRLFLLVILVPLLGLIGGAQAILVSVIVEEILFLVMAARQLGFPTSELPRRTWRTLVATLTMAAVLWFSGFAWVNAPENPLRTLASAVTLGVAVYATVIAVTWQLAGRPVGAELEIIRAAGGAARRLLMRLRRPAPTGA